MVRRGSSMRRSVLVSAGILLLSILSAHAETKPPIRGLVSMGAYAFVSVGGQPVNTLAPLRSTGSGCPPTRSPITRRGRISRLVLAVNPYRTTSGGSGDPAFAKGVMLACRTAIGGRCVFDNHDLDSNLAPPLVPIYAYMRQLGPEIEFQTQFATPTDFPATIRLGVRQGASDRALPGFRRLSAGAERHAQALGIMA
jgi:hypothetical protein